MADSEPLSDDARISMRCRHCHEKFTILYSQTDHGKGQCPNCGYKYGQSDVVFWSQQKNRS
jgi:DNA-directed RNA polymerase subunit RPC12/RpoP